MTTPKTRLSVKGPDKRLKAFKLMQALRNKGGGVKAWHVGITSAFHVFVDIDGKTYNAGPIAEADGIAKWISTQVKGPVGLFETKNGFHIVTKQAIDQQARRLIYEKLQEITKGYPSFLDLPHLELSLKYAKSTLRVSKQTDQTPELRAIYIKGEVRQVIIKKN